MLALLVITAGLRHWSPLEYLGQPALLEIAWEFLAPHLNEFDEREDAMRGVSDG